MNVLLFFAKGQLWIGRRGGGSRQKRSGWHPKAGFEVKAKRFE